MQEWITYFAIGLGLSAVAGFRIFIPLFGLSLAAHFGYLQLNEDFKFLAESSALWIFGIAMVIEIVSFYIPYLDNMLDAIAVPAAGLAGTLALASVLPGNSEFANWAISLIAGGGVASTLGLSTVGARASSTVATGGLGNLVVSTIELLLAGAGMLFVYLFSLHPYILISIIVMILFTALLIIYLTFKLIKGIWRKLFHREALA